VKAPFRTWLVLALLCGLLVGALSCTEGAPQKSTAPPPEAIKYDPKLPLVLEYGRPSCPWCAKEKPILGEVARQYRGQVNVVAINTEEQPALADRAGVRLLPTIIVYRPGGQEMYRQVGFWPKEDMVAKLRELKVVR
jgi:thioredoxin 1